VVLELKNNLRNSVTLTAIYVKDSTADLVSSDIALPSGGTTTISGTATALTACPTGQAYSYNLTLSYTDDTTSATYSLTGDGTELEGICAN
jgi:hypothetical protein